MWSNDSLHAQSHTCLQIACLGVNTHCSNRMHAYYTLSYYVHGLFINRFVESNRLLIDKNSLARCFLNAVEHWLIACTIN